MYQIRKCDTYTITRQTNVASLDPEKFRNLSTPYEGESEEDFLNYISDLSMDDIQEELDEETLSEMNKFFDDADWKEWYNSAWDGEQSWFDIGEENSDFSRTGGFEVRHTTE